MPNPPARPRPVYLNLVKIRLPVAGILSIMHRLSGLLLFLLIPALLLLFDRSLRSEAGFNQVSALFSSIGGRAAVLLMMWALCHHLLAGIRFLLIDVHIGVDRQPMRASAWAVNVAAPFLAMAMTAVLT